MLELIEKCNHIMNLNDEGFEYQNFLPDADHPQICWARFVDSSFQINVFEL